MSIIGIILEIILISFALVTALTWPSKRSSLCLDLTPHLSLFLSPLLIWKVDTTTHWIGWPYWAFLLVLLFCCVISEFVYTLSKALHERTTWLD